MLDEKAWADYCRRTENAARRFMAAAPDDPFDRAEGLRYVARRKFKRDFLRHR